MELRTRSLLAVKKYFKALDTEADDAKINLTALEIDSRRAGPGVVFIAFKGLHSDGHQFIKKAFANGASCVIYTDPDYHGNELEPEEKRRLVFGRNLGCGGAFASWFYENPSSKMRVLGVTGTNGKSTVTFMVSQLLTALQRKCAVFGTLGFGFIGKLEKSANTTMHPVLLQRALAQYCSQGAAWAAMEVSSIGVCEGRVQDVSFAGGAFTNLTRDHLDYHKTEEAYFEAKKKFLESVPGIRTVINDCDPHAKKLREAIPSCTAFGVGPKMPLFLDQHFVWVNRIRYQQDGMDLEIHSSWGSGQCRLNLLGDINAQNFACALAMLLVQNMPFNELLNAASLIKPVPGRMECFYKPGNPRLIVDYAHTPDGVEKALKAVREHTSGGRVIIVMGCGGDRDPGKRAIMAIKACVNADEIIFTNDNPRTEDPDLIISDMLLGVPSEYNSYSIEKDRRAAIIKAYKSAGPNDVVLIAGKGHEDYQIFKDKTIHFSDREIARALIEGDEEALIDEKESLQ